MTGFAFDPRFPETEDSMGLYVHIPFCLNRCHYCGFSTSPYAQGQIDPYVDGVCREASLRADSTPVQSIYFGGGTPSLLGASATASMLDACRAHFSLTASPEITLEINPVGPNLDPKALRSIGVNRVSLGAQSFIDAELKLMGRRHSAVEAIAAFHALRKAGFTDISVDLLAGYPTQNPASLGRSIKTALDLDPEHVSVYLLEVKEDTPLARHISDGLIAAPDDDATADLYELLCETLTNAGYEHYEISNFAKPGHRSQHNLGYWRDRLYVGLGAGAHGMLRVIGHQEPCNPLQPLSLLAGFHRTQTSLQAGALSERGRRYANVSDPIEYVRLIEEGRTPEAAVWEQSPLERFRDALIMGSRLTEGVDLRLLGRRYGMDAHRYVQETVGDLADAGLFTLTAERLRLTARGILLSNVVFARWVD